MEPFGDLDVGIPLWGFPHNFPCRVVSKMMGQCLPQTTTDDHCCVGLCSRPNSEESIIRSEEIRKHCRLANFFIARCLSILKDVK